MMRHDSRGFALPVIMLVSLSLMIVGLTMLQNSSSLRAAIDDQYYNRIAQEAAQAGATYAVDCLSDNGYTQVWPKTGPLTQAQNCDGSPGTPAVTNVSAQPNTQSTFSVGNIEGRSDGAVLVTSVGTTRQLADGSSTVLKTYTATVKRVASSAYVKFSGVTFGYYGYDNTGGGAQSGAYYFVKGSDSKLRAAGANGTGQLGTGARDNVINPKVITIPDGKSADVTYTNFLSQGWSAFVKTTDGTVYGAGSDNYGQLGDGTTNQYQSTLQKFGLPSGEKATYVGLLGFATYVLTESHNLYAAGSCNAGALGNDCGGASTKSTPVRVNLPTVDVNDPNTIPVVDPGTDNRLAYNFVADYYTAYMRMAGGRVYGWGNNAEGELANGTYDNSATPVKIGTFGDPGQPKATAIAFDGISLFVLDDTGTVWATGDNSYGQLGINSSVNKFNSLQKVPIPASAGRVVQMSTDQWFVTYRTSSGQVWGAGINNVGQLGNGSTSSAQRSLVKFNLPSSVKAAFVYNASTGATDLDSTLVVGNNGKVYGAGGNTYGQLGNGTNTSTSTPVEMKVFDGKKVRAKSLTYGYGTSVVLSNKNTYYTVGNNASGQLGNGTTQNTNVPAQALFLQPATGSFIF